MSKEFCENSFQTTQFQVRDLKIFNIYFIIKLNLYDLFWKICLVFISILTFRLYNVESQVRQSKLNAT